MNQSKNKILFIKGTIIKRCLSLKSNRVQLLILKTVYTVNQSIKSVIKKERRFKNTKIFILVHPTNGLRPVPHTQ